MDCASHVYDDHQLYVRRGVDQDEPLRMISQRQGHLRNSRSRINEVFQLPLGFLCIEGLGRLQLLAKLLPADVLEAAHDFQNLSRF